MEFLLAAFAGLTLLALVTLAVVEGAYLIGRTWARFSSWWHLRRCSLRHATFRTASMRAYALGKERSPSLGQLRFTKSRRAEFSAGPNPYGYGPPRFPLEDDDDARSR